MSAIPANHQNTLKTLKTSMVLNRLHDSAKRDWMRLPSLLPLAPRVVIGYLKRKSLFEIVSPEMMKDLYIPISRNQGEFLYLMARSIGAKRIVEYGTSFGISTIYLAAAVNDNKGDMVIGTELVPSKHRRAIANIKEAGLDHITDIRMGDALETLKDVPESLDMVLLDGWAGIYMQLLELLRPKLRKGAIVIADNIDFKELRPYVTHMQSGKNGFISTSLPISDGFEYSYYTGNY